MTAPASAVVALLLAVAVWLTIGARAIPGRSGDTALVPTSLDVSDDGVDRASRRQSTRTMIWLAIAAGAGLLTLGPFATSVVAATIVGGRRARRLLATRRRRRTIERDLPETLDLFVLLLEAGLNERRVIDELGRRGPVSTRPAFADVTDRFATGHPFADSVARLRDRLGTGATALVDLLITSHRYGLPMADVVQQLSTEARSARRRRDEALARSLPVKLSFPLVVCTLPSFVLLAIVPAVMAALTSLGDSAF